LGQATQLKHNTFQPKEATRSAHSARPTRCASAPRSARTRGGVLAHRHAMEGSVLYTKRKQNPQQNATLYPIRLVPVPRGNSAPRATDHVVIENGYNFAIIRFAYTTNCIIITVEKLSNPLSIRNCDGAGASGACHPPSQTVAHRACLRSSLHLFCCVLCCFFLAFIYFVL